MGSGGGDAATCMDPVKSAGLFYDRLARLDYNGPNSPGWYAQAVRGLHIPTATNTWMTPRRSVTD